VNIVNTKVMTKRLQAIGNSAGIIIDRPILDLLGITQETYLDLKTDGKRLIITPLESERSGRGRLAKVQARGFWTSRAHPLEVRGYLRRETAIAMGLLPGLPVSRARSLTTARARIARTIAPQAPPGVYDGHEPMHRLR